MMIIGLMIGLMLGTTEGRTRGVWRVKRGTVEDVMNRDVANPAEHEGHGFHQQGAQ
jgi:hypothetical protein